MSLNLDYEKEVALQAKTRRATIEFINIVNDLWYDKSIELVLFRNTLVDKRASEILNLINYAKEFVGKPISVYDALDIAKAIQQIEGEEPASGGAPGAGMAGTTATKSKW